MAYTYDYANRLLTESTIDGSGFAFGSGAYPETDIDNSYEYDLNGNRTKATRFGVASTYSVNQANDEFLSGDGFSIPSTSYNADGCPLSVTGPVNYTSISYDQENRVTTLVFNSLRSSTCRYNGDGQRVEKVLNFSPAITTRYVYDGANIIADTD